MEFTVTTKSSSNSWKNAIPNEASTSLQQGNRSLQSPVNSSSPDSTRRCTLLPSQLLSLVKGLNRVSQLKREGGGTDAVKTSPNEESPEQLEADRHRSADSSEAGFTTEGEADIVQGSSKNKRRRIQILHPILGISKSNSEGEFDLTSSPPLQNLDADGIKSKEQNEELTKPIVKSTTETTDHSTMGISGVIDGTENVDGEVVSKEPIKLNGNDMRNELVQKAKRKETSNSNCATACGPKNIELLMYDDDGPNQPFQDITGAVIGKTVIDGAVETLNVVQETVEDKGVIVMASGKSQVNDKRKRKKTVPLEKTKRQRLDVKDHSQSNGVAKNLRPSKLLLNSTDTGNQYENNDEKATVNYQNDIVVGPSKKIENYDSSTNLKVCEGAPLLTSNIHMPTVELCFLPLEDPLTIEMTNLFPPRQAHSVHDSPHYPRNLFYKVDGRITTPVLTLEELRDVVLPLLTPKQDQQSASVSKKIKDTLNASILPKPCKPRKKTSKKRRVPVPPPRILQDSDDKKALSNMKSQKIQSTTGTPVTKATNKSTSSLVKPVTRKSRQAQSQTKTKVEPKESTSQKNDRLKSLLKVTTSSKKGSSKLSRKRRKVTLTLPSAKEIEPVKAVPTLNHKNNKKLVIESECNIKPMIGTPTLKQVVDLDDPTPTKLVRNRRSRKVPGKISTTTRSKSSEESALNHETKITLDVSTVNPSTTPHKASERKKSTTRIQPPEQELLVENLGLSITTRSKNGREFNSNDNSSMASDTSTSTVPVQGNSKDPQKQRNITRPRRRSGVVPEKIDGTPIPLRSNRSHPCYKCGLSFSTESQLAAHSVLHPEEKSFSCSFCEARFTRRGNLVNHLIERHSSCTIKKA